MLVGPVSDRVRIAIIGYGNAAGMHARALRDVPNGELAGVWGRDEAQRRKFAAEYGVRGYEAYEDVLSDPSIDVVDICLPGSLHAAYGKLAAGAGKHVIVEKPIDVTPERGEELIGACRDAGVKLSAIFQNRFSSGAERLKAALDGEVLGKVILGDAYVKWYRSPEYYSSKPWRGTRDVDGGGALMVQAIHTIDLLQWLVGDVKAVCGLAKASIHDIQSEDLATAVLQFENGALGVIEGATAIYPGFPERIEVHGENGSAVLEAGRVVSWKVKGCNERDYIEQPSAKSGSSDPMGIDLGCHSRQLEAICRSIINDTPPPISGEDGIKAVKIITAIYESAETYKWVSIV